MNRRQDGFARHTTSSTPDSSSTIRMMRLNVVSLALRKVKMPSADPASSSGMLRTRSSRTLDEGSVFTEGPHCAGDRRLARHRQDDRGRLPRAARARRGKGCRAELSRRRRRHGRTRRFASEDRSSSEPGLVAGTPQQIRESIVRRITHRLFWLQNSLDPIEHRLSLTGARAGKKRETCPSTFSSDYCLPKQELRHICCRQRATSLA